MALGSSMKTHFKRAGTYGVTAKKFQSTASKAAKKGQCKVAMLALMNAGIYVGMRNAEAHGTIKRKRKHLSPSQLKSINTGLRGTYNKVMSKCGHKK